METYKMYINGEWVNSSDRKLIDVRNPATNEIIAQVQSASTEDVHKAIASARTSFDSGIWSRVSDVY